QAVNQHRVNRINSFYNSGVPLNWDGTGMSIGVMSDSFDSQPSEEGGFTTAPADVASQDLPGTGNTTNSQPVVVLQDYNPTPGATNEGRAMCEFTGTSTQIAVNLVSVAETLPVERLLLNTGEGERAQTLGYFGSYWL